MTSTISLGAAGPMSAQKALIMGARLNPTPTGVEVVLETLAGGTPEVLTSQNGETFIAEIVNAQLSLPGREGNQVRVTITGATPVP